MDISNETILKENQKLIDFINSSPTAYNAVDNICGILADNGFMRLYENTVWDDFADKGYVVRNDSSLIAYRFKDVSDIKSFRIVCAHTDSPMFKIKENGIIKDGNGYTKLNVEKYGGMIVDTWFDRPLSIAGRVIVNTGEGLKSVTVDTLEPVCIIPNLAIHMSRDSGSDKVKIQNDCQAVLTTGSIDEVLKNKCDIYDSSNIYGYDLYICNNQSGCVIEGDEPLVCAPRLDDLQCAYEALEAFLQVKPMDGCVDVLALFDNEEVGSLSRQGAMSDFLRNTLENICEALGINHSQYKRVLSESFMISADNAHAVHPNHAEKADLSNKPIINGGVVIKYQSGLRYTTDGFTGAVVKRICQKADITHQIYYNNSDISGGSTLGNLVMENVSVPAADIGAAQLAMHSCYETAGAKDTVYLQRFFKAFFMLENE